MAKGAYIGVDGVARKVKKGYVGVSDSYTILDYIQSSGTQYIDTGFMPNQDTRVVCTANLAQQNTAAWLFGARNGTGAATFGFLTYQNAYRSDYNTSQDQTISDAYTGFFIVDKDKNITSINGETKITNTAGKFQANYPIFLFANNNGGSADGHSSCAIQACQIYDNGALVRDFKPCRNSSGVVGLLDIVNGKFYGNAGTGTFTAGSETGDPVLISGGVARKNKKAYIGVGGVARPCWSGGELAYYGTAMPLALSRGYLAATTIGDYALFGGGYNGSTSSDYQNTVDAYNTLLTRTTPTALSMARYYLAATTVGNYALFGGGYSNQTMSTVDAYNKSLTRSTPTALPNGNRELAATTVGNHALFAGGNTGSTYTALVNAYNTSLTRSTPTGLSRGRSQLAATAVGDYALFGGGSNGQGVFTVVDAYNTSLTRSTPTGLGMGRSQLAATTVGDYALFGGGIQSSPTNKVDAYNTSLTRSTPTSLSVSRSGLSATSVGDYALFGPGWYDTNQSAGSKTVDAYDASLTRTIPAAPSNGYGCGAATTVGNYALFGGGMQRNSTSWGCTNEVDVYTVA